MKQVALLSQRGRAISCLSVVIASTVQNVQQSFIVSFVFGVTLRLLVINISSSSVINTAAQAYYQRCVITCETVAVVHRRLCLQHLACCSVNTGSQARHRLRIAMSAYPTCIRRPRQVLGGFASKYCYAVWHGKTRMVWLPDGEKMLMICLFGLT